MEEYEIEHRGWLAEQKDLAKEYDLTYNDEDWSEPYDIILPDYPIYE